VSTTRPASRPIAQLTLLAAGDVAAAVWWAGRAGAEFAPPRDRPFTTREFKDRFTGKNAAEVRQLLGKTDYAIPSPSTRPASPPLRRQVISHSSGVPRGQVQRPRAVREA
jgi:hypothetical protein